MIDEQNNSVKLIEQAVKHLEEENINAALYDLLIYCRMRDKHSHVKKLKKILSDNKLRRKIGFLDAIKKETDTATEYYDDDKQDDPYLYDKTTEKEIIAIKDYAAVLISEALKEEEGVSIEEFLEEF